MADFFNNIFIGTDVESVKRFENKTLENDLRFLKKIFTEDELKYCFSNKYPSCHLTARFCAKEAVTKALYSANIKGIYYSEIEIFHDENKCPIVKIKNKENFKIKLSMSHSKEYATATALLFVENQI